MKINTSANYLKTFHIAIPVRYVCQLIKTIAKILVMHMFYEYMFICTARMDDLLSSLH